MQRPQHRQRITAALAVPAGHCPVPHDGHASFPAARSRAAFRYRTPAPVTGTYVKLRDAVTCGCPWAC